MGSPLHRSSRVNKTWYSLPVHCLTAEDLQHENSRGVNPHFHAPENQHNRFLASLTTQERVILRDVGRALPYNTKRQQQQQLQTVRPGKFISSRPQHVASGQMGVPCYSMKADVAADLITGRPASGREEAWRVAHVKSYAVATSKYGYGEAGSQAYHQRYSWYKFHGFAGKGAKTSWASNPSKYHAH